MPPGILGQPDKHRGLCIEDRIELKNPYQRIVPVSGVGVGEDPRTLREILADVDKIKPHVRCGKAALVLDQQFRVKGISAAPHPDQVDQFAVDGATSVARELGIEPGRTLRFHDGRRTQLTGSEDHHPSAGAVIGLSDRFLHNLLPRERDVPPQFRLAGHYYDKDNEKLREFAAGEALLAVVIASGKHGVGIIPGGFEYTALVDKNDPQIANKLRGLAEVWDRLQKNMEKARQQGSVLNDVKLNVVPFRLVDNRDHASVMFG